MQVQCSLLEPFHVIRPYLLILFMFINLIYYVFKSLRFLCDICERRCYDNPTLYNNQLSISKSKYLHTYILGKYTAIILSASSAKGIISCTELNLVTVFLLRSLKVLNISFRRRLEPQMRSLMISSMANLILIDSLNGKINGYFLGTLPTFTDDAFMCYCRRILCSVL